MEHRWGERVRIELPVRIAAHPFAIRVGKVLNLSVSGAFLKVDFAMRPLSKILVTIEQHARARSDARPIAAYVTRRSQDGVGIEWCEFAPPEVSRMLQIFTTRRHVHLRKHELAASVAVTRLSAPLLKHRT